MCVCTGGRGSGCDRDGDDCRIRVVVVVDAVCFWSLWYSAFYFFATAI